MVEVSSNCVLMNTSKLQAGQLLEHIINEYSIPRLKVTSTVTDNGGNFVKAFKVDGVKINSWELSK